MPLQGGLTRKFFLWTLMLGLLTLAPDVRSVADQDLTSADLGLISGFQDYWDNHYRRGRALVAQDFDGDGRVDFFLGNPGDESFILRNEGTGENGQPRFVLAQLLPQCDLAFAGSAADYDQDGDLDLFVGCGGLEGMRLDRLYRNDSVPGRIWFTDVTREAGVLGPVSKEAPDSPVLHATAGAAWGDYDRDGDPDLFISVRDVTLGTLSYHSVLWRNNGNGTFTDVTVEAGLDHWGHDSPSGLRLPDWGYFQNSSWIDVDNDGDLDLFLNNAQGPNVLWKNLLVEQGKPRFVNATAAFSLPGEDLRYPIRSFSSAVADFNNDGWQDLMLFADGTEPSSSPYGNGNGLFLNRRGEGFYNVSKAAGIDMPEEMPEMAMGSQVADLNADGIPDLLMGGGDPGAGGDSMLMLSLGLSGETPVFRDGSDLINFEPEQGIDPSLPPYPQIPPFPYRTHGTAAADVDNDGHLELGVLNGGTAAGPPIVREPNRLFKFGGPGLGNTFRVRLRGNGGTDSRDAIGARAYVEIPDPSGTRRVFQTVLGGSAFSAQNELTLTFGLGPDRAVSRLAILWASGCLQVIESPAITSPPLTVQEACWTCSSAPNPVQGWLDPETFGCSHPPMMRVSGRIEDSFGSVPWARAYQLHSGTNLPVAETRSDAAGLFTLQHPYVPGICSTFVVEPFGYLPAPNPVLVCEDIHEEEDLTVTLTRGTEERSPRPTSYWYNRARSLAGGLGNPQDGSSMGAWMESIRQRYPGLAAFDSPGQLASALDARSQRDPKERLHRHLAASLLNLASGRLASFTRLTAGQRVGDLVEQAYHQAVNPAAHPLDSGSLAEQLEALNEGRLLR